MDRNDLFKFTDITDDDIDRMVEEFRTRPSDEEIPAPVIDRFASELDAFAVRAQEATSSAPTFETAFSTLNTAPAVEEPSPIITAPPSEEDTSDAVKAPKAKRRKSRHKKEALEAKTLENTEEEIVPQDVSAEATLFTEEPEETMAPSQTIEDVIPDSPQEKPTEQAAPTPQKRNGFMRFLGELVPHVGDSAFDMIRKTVMLLAIVVFVGAGTYLLDDLVLIPVQNEILVDSLQALYNPDNSAPLTPEEENYTYPEGMDPAFKKLYYQNNDVRGWISFHSTDNSTIVCDYPIVQSTDNDYYLHRDYYKSYNKNGTLFYDYRNTIAPDAANKNIIIYGHNMLSGQMFAGLNRLPLSLTYARTAPSFSMNTLYSKNNYKVFAVMVIDADPKEGKVFDYLRTEFVDNVDFATYMSEIVARSMYVYGDVNVTPDDEIVILSTCGEEHLMKFKTSRTVVVARKVREGEDPATDVSKITVNDNVIMPLAWYRGQNKPIHPYYTDINYVVQPLDGILDYLATSTADPNNTTPPTEFPFYFQDGTFGLIVTQTTTTPSYTGTTLPHPQSMRLLRGRTTYVVGEAIDTANTKFRVTNTDGSTFDVTAAQCEISGFSSAAPGTCTVTFKYSFAHFTRTFTILPKTEAPAATTPPTAAPTTAQTTAPSPEEAAQADVQSNTEE